MSAISLLMRFMADTVMAQRVHSDNLGDETSGGGSIFKNENISRATLSLVPHLAQQLVQEKALAQKAQLQNVPKGMLPPSLGPGYSGPQLGLGQYAPRAPDGTLDSDKKS